jgi:phage-related baseplate assembly protein
MSFLTNLPYPTVIEKLDYNAIKLELEDLIKAKIPEWETIESDRFMAVLEAIAYREMLLRARINDSILSMLIPYATGNDLDNIVALYGVERLKGVKPRATVEFSLSTVLSVSVTIPKGTLFRSDRGDIARLIVLDESSPGVTIPVGQKKANGILELDEYVKESTVRTEYIQTPLPFVMEADQTSDYAGGAGEENDEALRKRAILSLDRFSTAGSARAYEFWTLSANSKIEEAKVTTPKAGTVRVYIKVSDNDADIVNDVIKKLNAEEVRPLTDTVEAAIATRKTLRVEATIELLDLNRQTEITEKIKDTTKRFKLGEDVNISYLYKTLHQEGVYRVTNLSPETNQLATDNEFYEIIEWVLEFKDAAW